MGAQSALRNAHAVPVAHAIANLFPLLEGAAFDALVEDIRAHGQLEPILVDAAGVTLDGRNRWRACRVLGIKPTVERWQGKDPTAVIISRNLHRRHLSEAERAFIAEALATRPQGRPKKTARSGGFPPLTQAAAANQLQVSEHAVRDARVVSRAPEVRAAVIAGDLSLDTAARELRAGRDPLAVHFSSESAEHYTPAEVLDAVIDFLGAIDLDPCSNSRERPHVKAAKYFTRAEDGLKQRWQGRVFMNPPYGREIDPWIEKLVAEVASGNVSQAIALVPARIDTAWFRRMRNFIWCAVEGRLTFVGNKDSAPFPSAIVYLDGDGDERAAFCRAFAAFGDIWQLAEPDMFGE